MPSSTSSDAAEPRRDRGQAAVEFALAIPLVVVLALGVVQVTLIGLRQVAVDAAARDAARVAAVAADPQGAAVAAASASSSLDLAVTTTQTASTVTVTVIHRDPTSVPIVGQFVGDVELRATATMPKEPP